jgi:hypothetical protein
LTESLQPSMSPLTTNTPSILKTFDVLDKVLVWEHKSWITFELLSLKYENDMCRFVLQNTIIKVYIHISFFDKYVYKSKQSYALEIVSLS